MTALESLAAQVLKLLEIRLTKRQLADINHELFSVNAQLETAFEVLPNLISMSDVEGRYIGCNASFASFLGLSKQEIMGKNCYATHAKEYSANFNQTQ